METGNGSNQPQQRYCPTPIMAPPSVASSPPLMSGGNVIGSMHQVTQSHHPPPSISPHPSTYYGHHSSATSHYPTPTPTPPPPAPMHHQQYYAPAHNYYAHAGSHQQQQQHPQAQQQQSQQPPPQHHGISSANSHVSMNTQPQGTQQQSLNMMGHSTYSHHHPPPPPPQQHQSHHQQWAPHQQQSHHQPQHYYHQPTHHPPPQTHQQPAPQQHVVYPPPSPSPYSYMPPHPAPTPPPPSTPTHPAQQQQQHLQPTPTAPPPPQAQPQQSPQPPSHALMNLSRFVSQSPSPNQNSRASPGHHQPSPIQQTPSAYAGHMEHHPSMNGHPGHSPVMSSPPPPPLPTSHHNNGQQAMSPPPSLIAPQNHHLMNTNQQQQQQQPQQQQATQYNINNGSVETINNVNNMNVPKQQPVLDASNPGIRESHNFHADMTSGNAKNSQDHMNSSLPYVTKDSSSVVMHTAVTGSSQFSTEPVREYGSWSESEKTKPSGMPSPSKQVQMVNTLASSDSRLSLPVVQKEGSTMDDRALTPDYLKSNGNLSGGEAEGISMSGNNNESSSPQSKPNESPSNSGNGHQMMPVRLQNMQKGARTKASMKKLLQEQHIATPNGQASDASFVDSNSAKDMDPEILLPNVPTTGGGGKKSQKAPRKKKSQSQLNSVNDSPVVAQAQISNAYDLNSTPISADVPVIRPGYTKSGKKIGRPRKDASLTGAPSAPKAKGKRGKKALEVSPALASPNLSSDVSGTHFAEVLPGSETEAIGTILGDNSDDNLISSPVVAATSPKKKKGGGVGKGRKRTAEVLDEPVMPEQVTPSSSSLVDLNQSQSLVGIPDNESVPSNQVGGKRRKKSKANAVVVDSSLSDPMQPNAEISFNEAKATAAALRVIQPTAPASPAKGKRKKKATAKVEAKAPGSQRRKRASKVKDADPEPVISAPYSVAGEAETAVVVEAERLSRLRSRSPKQRESPPLRISSPRAAKERSVTPSSTNPGSTPTRSRASKEKEVVTPLQSPALKSPKKGSPKGSPKKGSRPSMENPIPEEEILSPPMSKRTRQLSKESSDAGETGLRRVRQNDLRSSIDSDNSLFSPTLGRRTSRRKSGSVSGSTDDLSSPGFKTPNSMDPPIDTTGIFIPTTNLDIIGEASSTPLQPTLSQPLHTSTPMPMPVVVSKRGKTKKSKASSKPRKSKAKLSSKSKASFTPAVAVVDNSNTTVGNSIWDFESQEESESLPLTTPVAYTPLAKSKKPKAKKGVGKRGKKRITSTELQALPTVAPEEGEGEAVVSMPIEAVPAPLPTPAKRKGRRSSKSKGVKQKAKPGKLPALTITKPAHVVQKKKGRSSIGKSRSKGKKGAAAAAVLEADDISVIAEPVEPVPETSEVADNKGFYPPAPAVLMTAKRRRSSAASSVVNTQQSSAKAGTSTTTTTASVTETAFMNRDETETGIASSSQSPQNSRVHRRDSSTLSRDYDVSVVLTDIAHSWSGDRSLSTNNITLPSSSSANVSVNVFQTSASGGSPIKSEYSKASVLPSANLEVGIVTEGNAIEPAILKKRQSKKGAKVAKEPKIKLPKKQAKGKKKGGKVNREESEVAQILLNLNTDISSKSPSPAKSIPDTTPPKKARKPRKPKAPKNSVNAVDTLETVASGDSVIMDQQSSIANSEESVNILAPLVTKTGKRAKKAPKAATKRRLSQSQKNLSLDASMADISSSSVSMAMMSQQFNLTPLPTSASPTSVKVTKTVKIPTADSLENADHSDPQMLAPASTDSIATPAKQKGKGVKRKMAQQDHSPDITNLPSSSNSTPIIKTGAKRGRSMSKASAVSTDLVPSPLAPASAGASVMLSTSSESELPPPEKKKRQRKAKNPEGSPAKEKPVKPTSKLFPYSPKLSPDAKRPTVFAKSVPGITDDKDDDNQKKKTQDAPTLRVIGGKTKFYRGGEEEEVDQDPKLPKEKGTIQTDNDVPWECSFCHLGPHAQKLGDLFGPYFADLPSIYGKPSMKRETWMHGDCALWAGRLTLVGTYLRRLEETLQNADKETCTICQKTGATIGCLRRGCKEAVHYPCAIRRFWKIDGQNFYSYCPLHKA